MADLPTVNREGRRPFDRPPGPGRRLADYLDARVPFMAEGRGLIRKVFPDHWSFLLGELALYSLVLLILTGVYLTFLFKPGMGEITYQGSYLPLRGIRMTQAYASTLDISFDRRGGLLIRQVHHWAALLFVAAIGAHLLRVFLTGAFRRPRELNWVLGTTLFVLALLEGFCGYSLPDDLVSGTGLRIAEGVMLSIPLVGTYLALFAFGGQYPGTEIIPRLYTLHILLVPGLLLALVGAHLTLVFYLKHTQWAGPGRTNRNVVGLPFFPQFLTRTLGLMLAVFGVTAALAGLLQINPIWRYGPYRPDVVTAGSQPDWYIGFLEGSLRLMPAVETRVLGHTLSWNVLLPAVVLPGLMFGALYAYPFLERWITAGGGEHNLCDRPRNVPTRTALGVAGVVFYAVLLLAGANDILADTFHLSLGAFTWALRGALIVLPPVGFVVAERLCLALRSRDRQRLAEGEETGEVRQSVDGGYEAERRPLSDYTRYRLLAQDRAAALPPQAEAGRVGRLRRVLSGWYYRDEVSNHLETQGRGAPPISGSAAGREGERDQR